MKRMANTQIFQMSSLSFTLDTNYYCKINCNTDIIQHKATNYISFYFICVCEGLGWGHTVLKVPHASKAMHATLKFICKCIIQQMLN